MSGLAVLNQDQELQAQKTKKRGKAAPKPPLRPHRENLVVNTVI